MFSLPDQRSQVSAREVHRFLSNPLLQVWLPPRQSWRLAIWSDLLGKKTGQLWRQAKDLNIHEPGRRSHLVLVALGRSLERCEARRPVRTTWSKNSNCPSMCWALIDHELVPSSRTTIKNITLRVSLIEVTRVKVGVNLWLSHTFADFRCYVALIESRLGETATFVFFGVFDGHGGPYCAEHVVLTLQKDAERQFNLARSALWNRWIFFLKPSEDSGDLWKTLFHQMRSCEE